MSESPSPDLDLDKVYFIDTKFSKFLYKNKQILFIDVLKVINDDGIINKILSKKDLINDEIIYNLVSLKKNWKDTEKNKERKNTDRGKLKAKHIISFLRSILKQKPFYYDKILDIGCGDGCILNEMSNHLKSKINIGIDLSSPKDYNGTFLFANLGEEYKSIENKSIDFIICHMSLHHIPYLQTVLDNIVRIIKPGGIVFISEHDFKGDELTFSYLNLLHGIYNKLEGMQENYMYNSFFSFDYLNKELTKRGLILIKKSEPYGNQFKYNCIYQLSY